MHLLTFTNAQTQAYSFHALPSIGPFLSLYVRNQNVRKFVLLSICTVNLTK